MRAPPVVAPAPVPTARGGPDGPEPPWQWPVDVTVYDGSPQLTAPEANALELIGDGVRAWPRLGRHQPAWQALTRLVRPLADVRALVVSESHRQRRCADAAVAAILRQYAHEDSAYWAWPPATWVRILGATQAAFRAVHPPWVDRQVRHYLIALPYLLGCLTDLRPLGNYKRVALAEKVFGPARVQATVARVAGGPPPGSCARRSSSIAAPGCTISPLRSSRISAAPPGRRNAVCSSSCSSPWRPRA